MKGGQNLKPCVFMIANEHIPKEGMTVSTTAHMGTADPVHYFTLGPATTISAETYDRPILYIGAGGSGEFILGEQEKHVTIRKNEILYVAPGTLCGSAGGENGFVYTEILLNGEKEISMNNLLKAAEVFRLKDMIGYEKDSIANIDLVAEKNLKFMILSFDEGCALSEHRAPGDALLFALEGKAVIGYEGKQYPIQEGENFRFEKNGLHSVTADGRFKMALLLVKDAE